MKACRLRVLFETRKCGKGWLCLPAGKPPDHAPQPERQWRRFPHRQVFFAFRGFHFLLFCITHPSPRIEVHSSSETFGPSPFAAEFGGYFAAVQNNVFPGQGSALIETNHRAELVLPPDAHLPVTLHRHSVKEACVLAIQRGILATTAECLFIFHCAERNEDKAGASCAPFSFPILHESYMATQKLLSEAFSLQEEL